MSASPLELFRRFTHGVYVIAATHEGRSGAFTAAWVTPASFDPLLVVVSINPGNATWPLIQASGRFVINILTSGQQDLARRFGTQSGRDVDKLAGVPVREHVDAGPVLADALGWLECGVERQVPAGDHVVVIARALAGDLLDPEATPMHYRETGDMDGSASVYPERFPGA